MSASDPRVWDRAGGDAPDGPGDGAADMWSLALTAGDLLYGTSERASRPKTGTPDEVGLSSRHTQGGT